MFGRKVAEFGGIGRLGVSDYSAGETTIDIIILGWRKGLISKRRESDGLGNFQWHG
jgi:hypothetical protein